MREKIYGLVEATVMVCVVLALMTASLAFLCLCIRMANWILA